jgi:hypothetical protein
MPFLQSSFARRGKNGSSEDTVAVYTKQLKEKEFLLIKEGNGLNQADYDELTQLAKKYATQLETPSQRASLEKEAIQYQVEKHGLENDQTSVQTINAWLEDEYDKQVYLLDDPAKFVQNRIDNLNLAISEMENRLSRTDTSDSNWAVYDANKNEKKREMESWQTALKGYLGGRKESLTAHFKTDPLTGKPAFGEYVPSGMPPKYVTGTRTTDRTIDGIPLKLFPNLNKPNLIGANWMGEMLQSPGVFEGNVYDPKTNTVVPPPAMKAQNDTGEEMNLDFPAKNLIPTPTIPIGEFAMGKNQTIYQNKDGENYTKYINISPSKIGASLPMPLPSVWESRINQKVTDKIDGNKLEEPQGFNFSPQQPTTLNLQGSSMNPITAPTTEASSTQPSAIKQPQGAELSQQRTNEITKGGLFNKIVQAGKRLFTG